jgi:hypothetical protein
MTTHTHIHTPTNQIKKNQVLFPFQYEWLLIHTLIHPNLHKITHTHTHFGAGKLPLTREEVVVEHVPFLLCTGTVPFRTYPRLFLAPKQKKTQAEQKRE